MVKFIYSAKASHFCHRSIAKKITFFKKAHCAISTLEKVKELELFIFPQAGLIEKFPLSGEAFHFLAWVD